MRSEDLGLVNTFACLGALQSYFSPQTARHQFECFFSLPQTHQTQSSVGKLLQCGHKYDIVAPPCTLRWRDDASQVICTTFRRCSTFLPPPSPPARKASFTLSKAFSETFNSFLTVLLYSSHSPLQREKALLHHSMRAVSVIGACNLLQVLSEWRCQLPLTLYSCLLSEPLYSLFLGESIPTFLARVVLLSSFSRAFQGAHFAPRTLSTANLSMVCLLLPPENRCNISGINWSCLIPHLPVSPPTPTARIRGSFRCTDSHNETSAFAEH